MGSLLLLFFPVSARALEVGWLDLNSKVVSLYQLQHYPEALSLAQQALAVAESTYGEEHPYTAASLNNLAALYQTLGRYPEAEPLYRRALAIDTALFGELNPQVQTQRHNLEELQRTLQQPLPPTGGEEKKKTDSDGSWKGWNRKYWSEAGLTPPGEEPPQKSEGAESGAGPVSRGFHGWKGDFSVRGGYRLDHLNWTIAGNIGGRNPNILSELKWDNIESYTINGDAWVVRPSVIAFKGSADYGWIFAGDNQDSDYLSNNRVGENSRSNNTSDDGYVVDASGGIGYPWQPTRNCDLRITPLVGYSYHRQHLTITNGHQTIPATGDFGGLNSRYVTQWVGPWAGLDLTFMSYEKIRVHAGGEYHWASYLANARWNLRTDYSQPKSYRHTADGNGIVVETGLEYDISNHWGVQLEGNFQTWSTDPGLDRTYFKNSPTSETRLNQVNWDSWNVSLGAKYRF